MTVNSLVNRVNYAGSGIVGPYSYPFRIFAATDLEVTSRDAAETETTLAYPADYSVSGVGELSGGSITLTVVLASGSTLAIRRVLPLLQTTELRNQGPFYAWMHEDAFDRSVMMLQQYDEAQSRIMSLPVTVDPTVTSPTLPVPSASKVLIWNPSATALINGIIDTAAIVVPGEGRTVASATAYLANNALYNVRDYGAVGDGVTDDTAAIQRAVNAARTTGGTLIFPFGRYLVTGPLDFTFGAGSVATLRHPITVRFESNTSAGNDPSSAAIIANHTGHVFDCAGSYDLVFENVNITTDLGSGVVAKTGWFFSRNAALSSAGKHTLNNCKAYGSFANGVVYSYASEENDYISCRFYNITSGGRVYVITQANIAALTSSFIAIGTGPLSNTVVNILGGSAQAFCLNGKVVYLEGARGVHVDGTFMFSGDNTTNTGHSLVYVDTVNDESNDNQFINVRADTGAYEQLYGVYFGSSSGTPARTCRGWQISGCNIPSQTRAVYAIPSVTLENFSIYDIQEDVSKGIGATAITNSTIIGPFLLLAIVTSTRNFLFGDSTRFTITNRVNDIWLDVNTGVVDCNGGTFGTVLTALVETLSGGTPLVLKNGGTTVGTFSVGHLVLPGDVTTTQVITPSVASGSGATPLVLSNGPTEGARVEVGLMTISGGLKAAALPSAAGASGTFWYDAADGNRVKFVP